VAPGGWEVVAGKKRVFAFEYRNFQVHGEHFAAGADEADDSPDPTESLPAASNRVRSRSSEAGFLRRIEKSGTSLFCEV
jgi:hypothetical protein